MYTKEWNGIVDFFNKNKNEPESVIQKMWEDIFADLGYKKILKQIESQVSFRVGSGVNIRADIILQHDNNRTCLIELKTENDTLKPDYEKQLFSYLNQAKINIGVLIADKIYLYSYEYHKSDVEQQKIEIDFVKNSEDGKKFVELMQYENFDSEKICSFIHSKIEYKNNLEELNKLVDSQFLIEALRNKLLLKYDDKVVSEFLNTFKISIDKEKVKSNLIDKKSDNIPNFNDVDKALLKKGGKQASLYLKKYFILKKLIDFSYGFTLSKFNKNGKHYWANPSIEVLNKNWCLVLNDVNNKKLYVFVINKNELKVSDVRVRADRPMLIDLEICKIEDRFKCKVSKIDFTKWLIKEINY